MARTEALVLPFPQTQPALFYADDSIFFFKPCVQQVNLIKMTLLGFQSLSGLALNRGKSDLLVTPYNESLATELAMAMGCRSSTFPIKYLGLPLSDNKLKKADYFPLINKIKAKLPTWCASILSPAGRLVLVNSCLTAIPIYFMSAFQLPRWVLKEIDKLRMRFYWHGNSETSKRLIMVPWDTICMPKKQRGLGVHGLMELNRALLGKWAWQWTARKDSLWCNLVNTLQRNKLTLTAENCPLRKAFREIAPLLCVAINVTPGDGSTTLFWTHNWGHGILKHRFGDLHSFAREPDITLCDFLRHVRNREDPFKETLNISASAIQEWETLQTILSTFIIAAHGTADRFVWKLTGNGCYTVKSLYLLQKAFPKHNSNLANIWRLKIAPRMQIFIWQMAQGKIATVDNLQKRGWNMPNRCTMCRQEEETVGHLFNDCDFFKEISQRAMLQSQ